MRRISLILCSCVHQNFIGCAMIYQNFPSQSSFSILFADSCENIKVVFVHVHIIVADLNRNLNVLRKLI